MKYGKIRVIKNANGESFFGKRHVKLAHGRNFAPKIFPGSNHLIKFIECFMGFLYPSKIPLFGEICQWYD